MRASPGGGRHGEPVRRHRRGRASRHARPFLELTASIAARWPDYPPYEGIHDELIAHVTLVECDDAAARERAMVAATDYGPFERPVDELTVITEDDEGRWTTRWRLPLG